MLSLIFLTLVIYEVDAEINDPGLNTNCLKEVAGCDVEGSVCGIRKDGEGYRLRIFKDECTLLLYACSVQKQYAYEETPMHYCRQALKRSTEETDTCTEYDCHHPADDNVACGIMESGRGFRVRLFRNKCRLWEYNCKHKAQFNITHLNVCSGLVLLPNSNYTIADKDLDSERNAIADNDKVNNEKPKHNMVVEVNKDKSEIKSRRQNIDTNNEGKFDLSWLWQAPATPHDINIVMDETTRANNNSKMEDDELYIKSDSEEEGKEFPEIFEDNPTTTPSLEETTTENNLFKNLIVVRGSLKDLGRINETINRFFRATHVFDLPVREAPPDFIDESTRRRLVKIAGPIRVYKPWIVIPKNISDDYEHRPTLNSCYHKCPRECPKTYAPVCGVPGKIAREPSIMFQNHCFMDVAQCKMYWENKSPTALSSSYQESSFVFCLGDVMNHMYSFLPLVKTLQHMGRLPRKGRFHYRHTNLKFFNNLLGIKDPRIMG